MERKRIIVTGGCGFIGSAFVRHLLGDGADWEVLNLDRLSYAASPESLRSVENHPHYRLEQADIRDAERIRALVAEFRPDAIAHFAAESHVDRSIRDPATTLDANVVGTFNMLSAALEYWRRLPPEEAERFRYLQVSTDEVFGHLGADGEFDESSPYAPRSPYAATKAAGDHLVRAWYHTYGLPVLVTNCSNNYGPYQYPEKLIPLMIVRGVRGETLPVYGKGENVRDWLQVEDHVSALTAVFARARPGESFVIGGKSERRNLDVVHAICDSLDRLHPLPGGRPHRDLIRFVTDRPGHDFRYSSNISKIESEIGWTPSASFEAWLERTVQWYLEHESWWAPILDQIEKRGR